MTNETQHAPTVPSDADGEPELIMFLEPDQLVIDKSRPVPRAELGPWTNAGLWALRVFVLLVTAMVIYTFFAQLG